MEKSIEIMKDSNAVIYFGTSKTKKENKDETI